MRAYAYGDHPLPVSPDQNIAAPLLAALMIHFADVKAGDVVFETGTDVGYQAALLSSLGAEVYSVELEEPLADQAARLLKELHYDSVHVQASDGYYGWAAHAPYDAMIIKEAIDHVPPPLLGQLKRGGPHGHAAGPGKRSAVPHPDRQRRRRKGARAAHHAGALLATAGGRAHLTRRAFASVAFGTPCR